MAIHHSGSAERTLDIHCFRTILIAVVCAAATLSTAKDPLIFWHTQGEDKGELLSLIIEEFNASNPPLPIEPVFKGGYNDIYRATKTALIGGKPPDLAVAYESMVSEYVALGDVVDLEPYMLDPKEGLSERELADFFPAFIELNRYPQFDDAYLSFPFTKSILSFYVNDDLIAEAGFAGPPQTWDEFYDQCVAMKKIGKKGYPISIDASTLDGMIMSRGGKILADDYLTTLFDAPASVETFAFLRKLAEADGLYLITRERDEDAIEFVQQNAPFFFRSSTRRPVLQADIEEEFNWSINVMPHAEGAEPATVLFGGNICVFDNGDERVRAAWHFIKYFASPEVTARWAVGSGYLPLRRSAADVPVLREWLNEDPVNRQVFDLIPYAQGEPAPSGWQEIREALERTAIDAIINRGDKAPEKLAQDLKIEADKILAGDTGGSRGITWKILAVVAIAMVVVLLVKRKR